MALNTKFRRKLKQLFDRRTTWLCSIFKKSKPGRPQTISRRHVDNAIDELQELVSSGLADAYARKEFEWSVKGKKSWHAKRGKGRGVRTKQAAFNEWYDSEFGSASCVYAFWKRATCEYVGKSSNGGGRPSSHFEKFWFSGVTRVDIYEATPRNLPAI